MTAALHQTSRNTDRWTRLHQPSTRPNRSRFPAFRRGPEKVHMVDISGTNRRANTNLTSQQTEGKADSQRGLGSWESASRCASVPSFSLQPATKVFASDTLCLRRLTKVIYEKTVHQRTGSKCPRNQINPDHGRMNQANHLPSPGSKPSQAKLHKRRLSHLCTSNSIFAAIIREWIKVTRMNTPTPHSQVGETVGEPTVRDCWMSC